MLQVHFLSYMASFMPPLSYYTVCLFIDIGRSALRVSHSNHITLHFNIQLDSCFCSFFGHGYFLFVLQVPFLFNKGVRSAINHLTYIITST